MLLIEEPLKLMAATAVSVGAGILDLAEEAGLAAEGSCLVENGTRQWLQSNCRA